MDFNSAIAQIGIILGTLGSSYFIAIKANIIELKSWRKDLKKTNAKINEETITSDDTSLEILSKRVNLLTNTVIDLQNNQLKYNKEAYELNIRIEELEQERKVHKKAFMQIIENCESLCNDEETKECKNVIEKVLNQLKINLNDICE